MAGNKWLLAKRPTLGVMLVYFILSICLTWPLIFQLDSTLLGDFGDSRGTVAWLWAKTSGLFDAPTNYLIAAPFGESTLRGFSSPISEWVMIGLAKCTSEVSAVNLFVIFSFALTAIATYCFLNWLLHNRIAAFVGGLIFGFCPAAVMQAAGGHVGFSFNLFIPIFLWALFNNRIQRTYISATYVAVSYALIVLSALYWGYFAIYIAIYFIVFDMVSNKIEPRQKIIWNYIFAGFAALCLILPFEYQAIYQQLAFSSEALQKVGHVRDFNELAVYSSRPWEFIIPSVEHPLLGKSVYEFVQTHLHGSNIFEQSLYLGAISIGLFLAGFVLTARGKFDAAPRTYFLFFAFGVAWMYFLSLPPLISIGEFNIPTVSYFSYQIAPMFRVHARFGILVNLFIACSVAVVLTHLYQKTKRIHFNAMLVVLLPVLVFEYWSIPANYAREINPSPAVYRWLARQPGDIVVAEYPMMNREESSFYTYTFWQRIHKKKLVNGAARDNEKAWSFFEKVQDLDKPQTPILLKSVGVKYVIIHGSMYQEGAIPSPIKRYYPIEYANATYNNGQIPIVPFPLKLVKNFGSDFVFSWEEDKNTSELNSLPQPLDGDL